MIVRPATFRDAAGMSRVLAEILALWGSDRPDDPDHVLGFYIDHPDRVLCSVAEDREGRLLGFQSLKRAGTGNAYGVTPGWGIIGTYVTQQATRRGVGSALFTATVQAAERAALPKIDATIASDNQQGLRYYEAIGFVTYRTTPGFVCKVYDVAAAAAR